MDAVTVGDEERGAATADDAEYWRQTARAKEAEFAELAAGSAELEALLEAELDTVTKHAEELSVQLQASNAAADAERERSAELQAELDTAKQHASEWRTRVASAETALERAQAAARASAAEVESLRASLEAAQEEAVMYALELDKAGDSDSGDSGGGDSGGGDSGGGNSGGGNSGGGDSGGGASPLPLTAIGEQERADSTPTEFASQVLELEAEIARLKRRQLQPTSPTAPPSEGKGRAKRAALEEERSKCAALGASLEEERSKCAALGASLEEERDKCDQLSEEMEELTETLVARNSLEVELRTAQQTIATLQANGRVSQEGTTTPRAPSPPSRVNDGHAKVTAADATRSSDGLALMSAQRCEALEKACAAAAAEVKEVRQAHRTAVKEVKELRQAHRTAVKEVKELRQAQRTSAAQVNRLKQQLRQSQARLLVRRNSRSGGGSGSSSGSLVAHATPPGRKSSGATEPTPHAPGSAPARASVATVGTQTVVGTPCFEAAAVSDVALTGLKRDTQVTPHVAAALGAEIASLRRSLKTMHAATLSLHECRSASALTPAVPRCDKAPAPAPAQQLQLQQAPATGSASGSHRLAAVAGSGGTQPEANSLATTPATRGSEQHVRPQVVRLASHVRELRRALGVLRDGCTEFMREGNAVLQRRLPAYKVGAATNASGAFAEQQAAGSTDTGEAAAMAELAADNERLRRRLRHATSVRSAPREGAAHGNTIGVYVRVRPRSQAEREARDNTAAINGASKQRHDGERPVSIISDTELAFYDARARMWRPFAFDGVFGPAATQQHLFEEVEALASGAVDGFHGCVLAFGQTGSGKTYSMEGKRAEAVGLDGGDLHNHGVDEGLSYRLASHIFRVIAARGTEASGGVADGSGVAHGENSETAGVASSGEADPEAAYIVRVSMVEIYNEQLRDLLAGWPTTTEVSGDARHPNDVAHHARLAAGSPTAPRLQIRQSAGRSNGGAAADSVHVTGLTQVRVNSVADVRNVLAHGNDARAVASTNVHEHSSRSHSIVQIEVSHRSPGEAGMTSLGRLSLVDLAGSERLRKSHATGDRLVEARHINKSLSALGDVLEALDRKASHVPYRNSCLTRLLQDSLGGRSSRTVMLATVAPTVSAAEETMFTLQFAARARHIDLGPVRRAVRYKNLNATVRKLRRELASSEQERRRLADRLQAAERDASVADRRTSESIDRVRRAEADERRAASARIEALRSNVSELTARLRTAKADRVEREADMRALHKRLDAERHTSASLRRQSATLEARVAALQRKLHRQSGQSGSPGPRPNARTAVVPRARASEDGLGSGSADTSDADNLALAGHSGAALVEVGGLGRAAEASGQPGQPDAGRGNARDRADSSGGRQSLASARAAVALPPAHTDADVASGGGSGAAPRHSDVSLRPVGRPRPSSSSSTQAVPGTRTRSRRDRSSAGAGTSGGRRSTKKDKSKRKPGWRF